MPDRQLGLFEEDSDDSAKTKAANSSDVSEGGKSWLENDRPEADTSRDSLESLFRHLPIRHGHFFNELPTQHKLSDEMLIEKVSGMLWGVAVGDSLGHCTEWRYTADLRHQEFGTIVDHLPTEVERRSGQISDDTQMTIWTLESLFSRHKFEFDDLAKRFADRSNQIVGRGKNTANALALHQRRFQGEPITRLECLGDLRSEGRGNGGLMRLSPIVLPYLKSPNSQLWVDAVLGSAITHGHSAALASAVGLIHLQWNCLTTEAALAWEGSQWLEAFLHAVGDLEPHGMSQQQWSHGEIPKAFVNFRGTLCDFLDGPFRRMYQRGISFRDACSLVGFGSGADCLQTVPAVLYLLMTQSDSFPAAMIAAINDTKDNDTIGAIIGALLGALHGKSAIRARWIAGIRSQSLNIEDRDGESDRIILDELIGQACRVFC